MIDDLWSERKRVRESESESERMEERKEKGMESRFFFVINSKWTTVKLMQVREGNSLGIIVSML